MVMATAWRTNVLNQIKQLASSAEADLLRTPQTVALGLRSLADNIEQLSAKHEASTSEPQQSSPSEAPAAKKHKKGTREFHFERYQQRYVALEIMYIGWKYQGFAGQVNTDNTIEASLFSALKRTKLIQEDADWTAIKYSRCGRTDRGVSALGQVVALLVRSNATLDGAPLEVHQEMDYTRVLNRALPSDIRVLSWSPVTPDFSARFSCRWREYKYFIPDTGALDLAAMRAAAQLFLGEHDFRNFCRVDVRAGVSNFRRRMLLCEIEEIEGGLGGSRMLAFRVRGTAFLWHQVRCMVAVMLMVGHGHEAPEIVTDLLDISKYPNKPQYNMAPEEPLLLYASGYPEGTLQLRRGPKEVAMTCTGLVASLQHHLVAAALTSAVQLKIRGDAQLAQGEEVTAHAEQAEGRKGRGHVKLAKRGTEPNLVERLAQRGIVLKDVGGDKGGEEGE